MKTATTNQADLLTAPGSAAIAIIRASGPDSLHLIQSLFSKPLAVNRCVHGELRDAGRVIDDPIIVLRENQSIEINLHGGAWVVQETLNLLERNGFATGTLSALELAEGANILQREINAHLPSATTELAVRMLLNQRQAWEDLVLRCATTPGAHLARSMQKADALRNELQSVLNDRALWWLLNMPRIAIIGAPNVGKSTLANQLFARQRVITADMPGTTRDWVGEVANLDGLAVMLIDTPGIRSTDDTIEAQAIEQSRDQIQSADLVMIVLDVSRPLDEQQSHILESWPDALRIINKTDAPHQWNTTLVGGIQISATTGTGIDALRQSIAAHFGVREIDENKPRCWTDRQQTIIKTAITNIGAITQILDDQ